MCPTVVASDPQLYSAHYDVSRKAHASHGYSFVYVRMQLCECCRRELKQRASRSVHGASGRFNMTEYIRQESQAKPNGCCSS